MTTRPSGTVTFLFTDIEGSTKLWENHHDWMERAHKRQEQIMREAITRHDGYAYKMIGDAFQVAFATARDALDAAIDAQRALHAEIWGEVGTIRVRMALHTGVTEERGDDYVGPVLNRAARLMSAGHGGQILISDATESLVRDRLPEGVTLRDMGERRLKDLTRAEHVYQVVAADLPSDFPSLKTLDTLPNNLPIRLTSFVGREKEIEGIKRLLATARLVTLTGAGGCGKTRLSLQVAAELLEDFANGVWFVELAPLADPALVPQSVANALNVQEQAGRSIQDALLDYLREKTLLLVLDNCEHLIDACAKLADELLHACPKMKILASSREALGIAGEVPHRVPSLSLPPKDFRSLADFGSLSQFEAVRLFVDRAVTIEPTFAVTNANAPAVAQICHRLDGIPLALELAAARVKVLSVAQISKRLDDRFKLLTGGSRTALPRQQTLRAAIDWSYSLLSEQERVLLRRLSVFAGGWTLEAAEEIANPNSQDPKTQIGGWDWGIGILDLLSRLVDKSLVIVEHQSGEVRYRMMETIRQYAREKLFDLDEGEEIRSRHLDYFLKFAEEVEPKLRGPEQFDWLDRLDIEHDNLRAALEWSLGEGRVEKGLRLAVALMWFWDMRAHWSEGRERVESLLIQPEATPRTLTRANALRVAANNGWLSAAKTKIQYLEELIAIAREYGVAGKRVLALGLVFLGPSIFGDDPVAAESMLEEGLAIARSLGDEWVLALLLWGRGWLFLGKKDHQAARKAFEESLTRFKSLGDKHWAANVSFQVSRVYFREGEFARARQEFEQGLLFFRETKDRRQVWSTVNALGEIARAEGRYDLAKRYYGEGLEIARELSEKTAICIASVNVGYVALHDGELNSARSLFVESLALAREMNYKPQVAFALLGFAGLAAAEKQGGRAVRLLAVVDAFIESGDQRTASPGDVAEYNRHLAIAREQLDEAAFNAAWAEGRAMTMEQAIEYAMTNEKSKN